jgi:hypothetical protein
MQRKASQKLQAQYIYRVKKCACTSIAAYRVSNFHSLLWVTAEWQKARGEHVSVEWAQSARAKIIRQRWLHEYLIASLLALMQLEGKYAVCTAAFCTTRRVALSSG